MPVRIKKPIGRPSFVQLIITDALAAVGEGFIDWQKAHRRVASGRSQNWVVLIERVGNLTPKDISGSLIGVPYINFALFGRKPGRKPPWTEIFKWLKIRGIRAGNIFGQFTRRTDKQLAHAIATDIGKYGTKALAMSETFSNALYTDSINKAIDKHLPDLALSEASDLVDSFVMSLENVDNIEVTTR